MSADNSFAEFGARRAGRAPGRRAVLAGGAAMVASVAGMNRLMPGAHAQGGQADLDALARLVAGPQRTQANTVRDPFRKPLEVLQFLGIRPDSRVIEISPGAAGYWTEILAPYLKDRGVYVAANPAPTSPASKAGVEQYNQAFAAKMASDPASFGKVKIVAWAPELPDTLEPGSADFVLTFRNLHNWMARGMVDNALVSFQRALKKGGVLGIKDHRGDPAKPQDPVAQSGYVRQDYAVKLVESAGFKFAGASEAVANPKDTRDHAAGVWSLPPTYREKDKDRAKYAAIGESDRFLLKFVKP